MDHRSVLDTFQKEQNFFIGFDSDGCVFDTMEIKHKECFTPAFIKNYDLQGVSKYVREVWEFVNLYSTTRGWNRFKAADRVLDYLRARPEVKARGTAIPDGSALKGWIAEESRLGNPALESLVAGGADQELERALAWSKETNERIADMVYGIPPFPRVREILESLPGRADAIVVSQTPVEALEREWAEHDMAGAVQLIAGQEMGTKAEHLIATAGNSYPRDRKLMVGDAPGDKKAADAADCLFYPILAGKEEESWERLATVALPKYFEGTYAGAYEAQLLDEFAASLPEKAPWE